MYQDAELRNGFKTGDWLVNPARAVVCRGGEEVRPEPKVFDLLMLLASQDGEIVSNDELIEKLWDNRPMADASLNRCVTQLRKVLGDTRRPYRYVENVPRRGYRLSSGVEPLAQSEADTTTPNLDTKLQDEKRAPSRSWLIMAPLLVALVIAVMLARDWIWPPQDGLQPVGLQTIGVLPFDNLSPVPGSDYLVGGFKDELVSSLHSLPGLSIVNSRLSYGEFEINEIAEKLGVEIVLGGSVQRTGDRLKINFTMSKAENGVVLVSKMLEGEVESLFELQSELAVLVRNEVLGEAGQVPISRSKPASFRAYDTYMRGLFAFDGRQTSTSLDDAVELFQKTIELDPSFGPAYVMLATSYTLLPTYRSVTVEQASALALPVLDRGAKIDPTIADTAGAVRGFFYHMERDWMASERAYRRAVEADVVDPTALLWYSRMLASVGRLEDSLEFAIRAVRMDPTSAVITSRVAMAYTWLGDYDNANEYFERANSLGAGGQTYYLAYALCLYQRGEIEKAYSVTLAASDAVGADSSWIKPVFAALGDPALAGEALRTIDDSMQMEILPLQAALIALVLFGDTESAFDVAERLADDGEIFEMDLLFIPQTKPLRQYDQFDPLMQELGLTDYWQQNGCAWQGQSFTCRT